MASPDEPAKGRNLKGRISSGLYWGSLGRVVQQAIQFLFTVALARLLTPGDYGLVAMVAVFTGFAAILADGGFTMGLVQKRDLDERHLSTIFWLNLGGSGALGASTFLAAPLLAAFFSAPALAPLFRAFAFNFVLGALGAVSGALLQRRMRFKTMAWNLTLALLVSYSVALVLALQGRGVWSLVVQTLVFSGVHSLLRLMCCRWRPLPSFEVRALRELMGFSGNLYAYNIVNYWARSADNLVVGKFFGASVLGMYNRAYTLMLLPVSQLNNVIAQVVFPAFSSIQADKGLTKRIYLRAIGMVALVTFPLMVGLAVTAAPFVEVVYGRQWGHAAVFLEILAPVGMIQAVVNTVGWIYLPQGQTKVMFAVGAVSAIGEIASFAVGVMLGSSTALAISYAIFNLAAFYPNMAFAWRILKITPAEALSILARPFFLSLAMGVIVYGVGRSLPADWRPWETLLVLVGTGAVVYAAMVRFSGLASIDQLLALAASRADGGDTPSRP